MQIVKGRYPEEYDWQTYVTLPGGVTEDDVNAVFLYRIAAFGKYVFYPLYHKKITFSSFTRTMEKQVKFWNDATQQSRDGGKVAYPGTSWHGYGLAADLSDDSNDEAAFHDNYHQFAAAWKASAEDMYNTYGIAFCVKNEDWHIQPVESIIWSGQHSKFSRYDFLDADDQFLTKTGYRKLVLTSSAATYEGKRIYIQGKDVKYLQSLLAISQTGTYDEVTASAVKSYQTSNGLTASGDTDQSTWEKLLLSNGVIPTAGTRPSTGGATTTTYPGGSTNVSNGSSSGGDEYYNDEIASREWKSYYTGEHGAQATIYLEKVKSLETQEKRAEDIALARAKKEFYNQDSEITSSEEYTTHIDKWETILNSTNPSLGTSNGNSSIVSGSNPYPVQITPVVRETYLKIVSSKINYSSDLSTTNGYSSIYTIPLLVDRFSVSSLDVGDPWAGVARKDVLLYLYLLSLEMEEICNKNAKPYNKISVSLARNNEYNKATSEQQLEHYCGLAADIYLPKDNNGVIIIGTDEIAEIISSMGIVRIGLSADYVHFDLSGSEEKIWSIDGYILHPLNDRDLSKTKNMEIPSYFL